MKLILIGIFWTMLACKNGGVGESELNTDESSESTSARIVREFGLNLVASGVSDQDAQTIAARARKKIDALSLVNVDTKDPDQVAISALQGALAAAEGQSDDKKLSILSSLIEARFAEDKVANGKAVKSAEELFAFYVDQEIKSLSLGSALLRVQKLISNYDNQYDLGQVAAVMLNAMKTAAFDVSNAPADFYSETLLNVVKDFLTQTVTSQPEISSDQLQKLMLDFLRPLNDVADPLDDNFDYSRLITQLGLALKHSAESCTAEECGKFRRAQNHFFKSAKRAVEARYGDSSEAIEIISDFVSNYRQSTLSHN